MELGMIGLGRMGSNMARRLLAGGHRVVAYDPVTEAVKRVAVHGAMGVSFVSEMVSTLIPPRAIWLMVPAGKPTEENIANLATKLSAGDILIDGGNSHYKDSVRRAGMLSQKGILFLDVGTSGGVWGLQEGYCLMIGGSKEAFQRMEPVFQTLASSPQGYGYAGPSGAGHFVKMVHNGIEYGLMKAYAEGYELMQAKQEFDLDLREITGIWRHGSVIRSWLLDLAARALQEDPELKDVAAYVEDSGEGRWMMEEAIELGVPIPVISLALQMRFRSRQDQPYGDRLLAALREQFGGHAVKKAGPHQKTSG